LTLRVEDFLVTYFPHIFDLVFLVILELVIGDVLVVVYFPARTEDPNRRHDYGPNEKKNEDD
jgi:hypothetical protein